MPKAISSKPRGADLFKQLVANRKKKLPWLTIYGPRKKGKTTCALTLTEGFAELDVSPAQRIRDVREGTAEIFTASNLGFISADQGGLDAALDFGVQIPEENVVYYDEVLEVGYGESEAVVACIDAAIEAFPSSVEWLVIDTISTIDKIMLPQNQQRGGDDTRAGYAFQLQAHRDIVSRLRKWPKGVVILAHARALIEDDPAKAGGKSLQRQKRATYGHSNPDVIPDITGKGAGLYLDNSSMIAVHLERLDLKSKTKHRRLYSGNELGYEGGTRFDSVLIEMTDGKLSEGIEPNLGRIIELYQARK